ncbi:MAG: portal protein, partial [Armatimonadota bacterium]
MAFVDIQKRYKAAREVRRYYERNWQLNIAFFMNEQWTTVDQTGRLRQVLPANNKKPRLSSNLIRPRVRLEYAAVASQPVKYRVVVRPPAPDAATKSKVAYSYLTYLWQTYDYGEMFLDALLWALICGTSFVKWYFDPHAGPLYDMGSVVEPAGDPLIDVVAPFELCIDPHARRLDEASWVVHERLRSREYVREKYGKEVSGGTGQHNSFIQALSLLKLHQVHHRVPSVLVCEYWEKPTARVPGGYYCVFAGNTVLYEGDNPYEETPIPFAAMRHTPTPGTVWGDSHVTDLRQINVVYNRLRCDILENSVKLSNPPLVAPHGSLWQEPEWTPGEVVYYNPLVAQGGKIDQVRIEPFPSQLVNMLLRLEQEADEHAGVTLLMRGMAPRGVRSAEQLSLLQQADETRRSIVRNEYLGMVEVALNGVLALARQFCVLPRLVDLKGDDLGAMLLKGIDIPRSS